VKQIESAIPRGIGVRDVGPVVEARGAVRPRVALVTFGAVDRFAVPQIVAHLIRRAHEHVDFVVISHLLADDLRRVVQWQKVRVPLWLPFRVRYPIFFLLAALRLRRTRADLVHTFGSHPMVPNRVDLATVNFSHAAYHGVAREKKGRLAKALAVAIERWCYRPARVRMLAVPSHGAKRELEQTFPGVEIVVIPNGVDPERFTPDAAARRRLRAAESVDDGDMVALFVGRLWHGKGLEVGIEAVACAIAGGVGHLRLWVVGDGDESDHIRLAERLGVRDRVRFFGHRADVERFLQAADVFVFPSLTETFGLACFEAAACGVPLIATAVSGVEELLGDGQAGFIVERTPHAFAGALTRLADPGLRARMGAAARERALHFTWEQAAAVLLDTYRRLLETPVARRGAA
jgi:glycosyltransferase involved in cell wall biosynthesis